MSTGGSSMQGETEESPVLPADLPQEPGRRTPDRGIPLSRRTGAYFCSSSPTETSVWRPVHDVQERSVP
jgi:hypothetical protein